MRYCFHCGRVTLGEPLFCNFCGRTFDVKLCNRLHENPREAEVCSQCGSRDLTTPQPKLPLWARPLLPFLSVLPGLTLLLLTAGYLLLYLYTWIVDPRQILRVMVLGLILGALWWVYMTFPRVLRRSVRRIVRRNIKKG